MDGEKSRLVPVILCGGIGTRLWPLSRSDYPKQFLSLMGSQSLYQQTLLRVKDRSRFAPPVVVTNERYRFIAAEQAEEVGIALGGVLLEPAARNTAPAIAAASAFIVETLGAGEDQLILVLPSDHRIADDAVYRRCVGTAIEAAQAGNLVAFGIKPSEPATGFGYIEVGAKIGEGAYRIARFVEKPPLAEAEAMLAQGGFTWNSGMFLFGAGAFMAEAAEHAPDVLAAAKEAVRNARLDLDFVRLDPAAFSASPDISVDYAIFERTRRAAVVPADITWSDLGSWDAVWKSSEKDGAENVVRGPTLVSDTVRSLVLTEGTHVTVDGLDDVVVIASADAVFVGRLSDSQKVGTVAKQLAADVATVHLTVQHPTTFRPWGGYTSLLVGERFQVKRLFVKPGKRLSLQKHRHRAEHWVVVRGTAEVVVGDEVRILSENESIHIPLGSVHRLTNPGKILLEVIEVQSGAYLGEDDIIRIDDEFGRA